MSRSSLGFIAPKLWRPVALAHDWRPVGEVGIWKPGSCTLANVYLNGVTFPNKGRPSDLSTRGCLLLGLFLRTRSGHAYAHTLLGCRSGSRPRSSPRRPPARRCRCRPSGHRSSRGGRDSRRQWFRARVTRVPSALRGSARHRTARRGMAYYGVLPHRYIIASASDTVSHGCLRPNFNISVCKNGPSPWDI